MSTENRLRRWRPALAVAAALVTVIGATGTAHAKTPRWIRSTPTSAPT